MVQTRLEKIIFELEKQYPYFKKMDIYSTVSNSYKKVHSIFKADNELEFQEVSQLAEKDLQHTSYLSASSNIL